MRSCHSFADPIACSHHRAPDYFSESIRSFRGFWGWPCGSYISYLLGLCPHSPDLVVAGEDCRQTTRGMFMINTRSRSPFAEGRWTDMPTTATTATTVTTTQHTTAAAATRSLRDS